MSAASSRTDHTTVSPAGYVAAARAAFERAAARSGRHERHLLVAGRPVRLCFAGEAMIPAIMPALAHLEVVGHDARPPVLDVAIFDTESTGEPMVPPAWGPNDWGAKGQIVGFNDDRIRTVYQPGVDILNLLDAELGVAVYWVPELRVIPWWESTFPLRTILHWWAAPTSLQPMHAGAVASRGVGVLVAGESGAGKSTTTLACLEGGLDYLGDDYVMIDVDGRSVHTLYSTAKLVPANLERFPQFVPLVSNPDDLDEQKAILLLHEHRPTQLCPDADVRAIVVPRVSGRPGTEIIRASPSQALANLLPMTLFHLPGFERRVFEKLSRLVRSVPCYSIDVGHEMSTIADAVGDLLEELPVTPPPPLVSVVVPVFNAGARLGEAISSIERQCYEPLEIIVVDDGSTDDTPAAIGRLGGAVHAVRQPNGGPAAARNRGLSIAQGDLYTFLDADDLWPEGKLQSQVGRLTDDPDLDVVLGRISYVPESGSLVPDLRFEDPEARTISNVHLGSGVYRRSAFERVGGFDATLRFSEDHDWFLRAREAGLRIRILDEVTLLYRLHGDNMTRGVRPVEMSLTRVLKMSLDRRRSAGYGGVDLGDWREFDERRPAAPDGRSS